MERAATPLEEKIVCIAEKTASEDVKIAIRATKNIRNKLDSIETLDLAHLLEWTWSTDFSGILLPRLKSLNVPVYNGNILPPPTIPRAWFANLETFIVTVFLETREQKEGGEEEGGEGGGGGGGDCKGEKEGDKGEREGDKGEKEKAERLLPSSVRHFAIHFCHDLRAAVAISRVVRNADGDVTFPFQLASVRSAHGAIDALFSAPNAVSTLEIGLAGRKPLVDVIESMRVNLSAVSAASKCDLLYKLCGLQGVEESFLQALTGIDRLKVSQFTAIDATALLVSLEKAFRKLHGMRPMTLEIVGAECNLMRCPARQSQTLMSAMMALRRVGFRIAFDVDENEEIRSLLSLQSTHIEHGGRAETHDDKKERERREFERVRCDSMYATHFGTIDRDCSPIEGHERMLRQWAPHLLKRDRGSLLAQKFRDSDRTTIQTFAATWRTWHSMASALAMYDRSVRVTDAMVHPLPAGVRVVSVIDGAGERGGGVGGRRGGEGGKEEEKEEQRRIVGVWDRDSLFNRLSGGQFCNDIVANYEYFCGLNFQIDPMSIVNVSRVPIIPTFKDLAMERASLSDGKGGNKDAAAQQNNEIARTKQRARLIAGVCSLGLRIQRPMVSVGLTPPRAKSSDFLQSYLELFAFASQK